MARQVIIRQLCDPCLAVESETDGEELAPLKLPEISGRSRVITLCEVHRKEFYEPFLEILQELGQPVDDEGNASGPRGRYKRKGPSSPSSPPEEIVPSSTSSSTPSWPCPLCEKTQKSKTALQTHTRKVHHKLLAEIEGEALGFTCPECGRSFSRANGLGAHRFRAHGVAGTSSASKAGKAGAAQA